MIEHAQAFGWAVVEDGKISVKSVSPERRGAIVNFLMGEKRIFITCFHTEEDIETLWTQHRARAEAVPVTIMARGHQ